MILVAELITMMAILSEIVASLAFVLMAQFIVTPAINFNLG
jgi:hypothetical protein